MSDIRVIRVWTYITANEGFAKRTLEIADRLGCGEPMVDKGVVWNVGRVFHGDNGLFEFNLLPEDGHRNLTGFPYGPAHNVIAA